MKSNLFCPVCNSKYDAKDEFCSTCSWELIHIPGNADNTLVKYYSERLNRHKENYNSLIETTASLKKTNTELLENVDALEERKKELELNKKEISKQKAEIEELTKLKTKLEEYENRFGDSLDPVNSGSKKIVTIFWEIESNELLLECDKANLEHLPPKVAILFSQKNPSLFFGKCDFILLGDIKRNKNKIYVDIKKDNISKGQYFIKPSAIDNKNAIIKFSSKAKGIATLNYDNSTTKINII